MPGRQPKRDSLWKFADWSHAKTNFWELCNFNAAALRYRLQFGRNTSSLTISQPVCLQTCILKIRQPKHTWYLSRTPRTLSVENFLVMWRNSRCGDILDVEKFWMWRNFTCGDILDVEKFVWFHELLALACQLMKFNKFLHMYNFSTCKNFSTSKISPHLKCLHI